MLPALTVPRPAVIAGLLSISPTVAGLGSGATPAFERANQLPGWVINSRIRIRIIVQSRSISSDRNRPVCCNDGRARRGRCTTARLNPRRKPHTTCLGSVASKIPPPKLLYPNFPLPNPQRFYLLHLIPALYPARLAASIATHLHYPSIEHTILEPASCLDLALDSSTRRCRCHG